MKVHTCENVQITKYNRGRRQTLQDTVVTELPLSIWLNGSMLATIICTPTHLKELAVGFLFSERLISNVDEHVYIETDEEQGRVRIETEHAQRSLGGAGTPRFITPGCLFGTTTLTGLDKIESELRMQSGEVLDLVAKASTMSHIYRNTGGVHSAALCSTDSVDVFREDIGRHNAIDKVIGHRLLERGHPRDSILITSGRISSAVIGKIIGAHIPIMVSSSAPTLEAVKLAEAFDVTLIGFARGRRMNIYTAEKRIADVS
jgi:FdhD protein